MIAISIDLLHPLTPSSTHYPDISEDGPVDPTRFSRNLRTSGSLWTVVIEKRVYRGRSQDCHYSSVHRLRSPVLLVTLNPNVSPFFSFDPRITRSVNLGAPESPRDTGDPTRTSTDTVGKGSHSLSILKEVSGGLPNPLSLLPPSKTE